MEMPGRCYNPTAYRYGFNGKENDNETVGTAEGTQDYGMRIYNPALGKFLSVDPLAADYPWYTPYQFAGNKPIRYIDLDGLEEYDNMTGTDPTVGAGGILAEAWYSASDGIGNLILKASESGLMGQDARNKYYIKLAEYCNTNGIAAWEDVRLVRQQGDLMLAEKPGLAQQTTEVALDAVSVLAMKPSPKLSLNAGILLVKTNAKQVSIKALKHALGAVPKSIKEFKTNRAAMRQAKRDVGIPTSQTYKSKKVGDAAESGKSGKKGITYTFEDGRQIQHHPEGHKFKDGSEWNQNHWNNHQDPDSGVPGTKNHYVAPDPR